jgi:hypothetical protein
MRPDGSTWPTNGAEGDHHVVTLRDAASWGHALYLRMSALFGLRSSY